MYRILIKEFLTSEEAKPFLDDESKLASCLGSYFGRVWNNFTVPPLDELQKEVRQQLAET